MVQLEVHREAVAAHYDLLAAGIMAHNAAHTGEAQGRPLTVLAQRDGVVVGGLWGEVFWSWLKVELLWVHESLRRQGLGRQLLRRAEAEAQRDGAAAAHLDTFSFQALEFYQKEGYEIFGTLPDFPPGHSRYYLKKALGPST